MKRPPFREYNSSVRKKKTFALIVSDACDSFKRILSKDTSADADLKLRVSFEDSI